MAKAKRALAALEALPPGDAKRARKPDNPVYINLKSQIESTIAQVQSLRTERDETRAKLALFDMRVSQTPEVEREYLELVRDMESSRARFRELRDKQMQAQVAEQLERGRKAERFTLIEPPIFPEKPYRPNRMLIVMLGLVLAVVGGVGVALLREAIDQTVHSPRDVMRVLQAPVLAVLPVIASPLLVRQRSRVRKIMAVCVLAAIGLVVAALHYFFMPIDVAWYSILRRLAG